MRLIRAVDAGWWPVLALGAVAWMGLAWRAPPAWLAVCTLLLPVLVLAVAVVVVARLLLRRRGRGPVVGLLVLLAGLWWRPAPPAPPEGATRFRLMTWNVQRLWGEQGRAGAERACVAEALERERPDVLVLQEVEPDDLPALVERAGYRCVHGDYLGTGREDRGGLAVCAAQGLELVGWLLPFRAGSPWRYLLAEVRLGPRTFNVMDVHLLPHLGGERELAEALDDLLAGRPGRLFRLLAGDTATERERGDQVAALLDLVDRLEDPTVLAGDLNSPPHSALHAVLRRRLRDAGWGSGGTVDLLGFLPLRFDYVYLPRELAPVSARVLDADCSNHRPLLVEAGWLAAR